MNQEFDFIGVGDVTTDAFINIDAAKIKLGEDGERKICMNYGDKIPYNWHEIVAAVGNSSNACVSAHRLGLQAATVTNIGDDRGGAEQLETIRKEGVDDRFVTTHAGMTSNYHYVLLHKADRTILVKHTEWPYQLPDLGNPKWMYLSSLAENSLPYHDQIMDFIESYDTKLAFQPGTFQMSLGYENLKRVYQGSELFFCNVEEAKRILFPVVDGLEAQVQDLATGQDQAAVVKVLLDRMHELGPQIPVITDGPDGAYARDTDGTHLFIPMYPDPKPPIDRTGAGDSFSSTFTAMYAETGSVREALRYGPINSMNVVQYVGAQAGLQSREQIEEHLANAPEYYIVKEI